MTEALSNILLGEKIPLDVINGESGEIIIPANRKITKTLLRKLAAVSKHVQIDPSPVRIKIMEIIGSYQTKFDELETDRERKIGSIEAGEGSGDGSIKQVKVYIATKQKLEVGDKMAGPPRATRASSPRLCPRKTCRSSRTALRSRSASTPSACLHA